MCESLASTSEDEMLENISYGGEITDTLPEDEAHPSVNTIYNLTILI